MTRILDIQSSTLPLNWLGSGAPRALHRFLFVRSLAAGILMMSCVPTAQYEEAQSAAHVAREAERRAVEKLASVEQELERLQEEHGQVAERAARYDSELAQAELDRIYLEKQRDEHAELVTQLRGELARVGDHLRTFSDERADLGARLEAAQEELDRLQEELSRARERLTPEASAMDSADLSPSSDPRPPAAPVP